jgi:hypothetical protein
MKRLGWEGVRPAPAHFISPAAAAALSLLHPSPPRFVTVDLDVAMGRVLQRQVALGLAPEVSGARIAGKDRPNGELINASSRANASVLVPSDVP